MDRSTVEIVFYACIVIQLTLILAVWKLSSRSIKRGDGRVRLFVLVGILLFGILIAFTALSRTSTEELRGFGILMLGLTWGTAVGVLVTAFVLNRNDN